jgi:hypothetical protein
MGTHEGEFSGTPATGRPVAVEVWTIDRYRDDIFIESRIIMDVAASLGGSTCSSSEQPSGPRSMACQWTQIGREPDDSACRDCVDPTFRQLDGSLG